MFVKPTCTDTPPSTVLNKSTKPVPVQDSTKVHTATPSTVQQSVPGKTGSECPELLQNPNPVSHPALDQAKLDGDDQKQQNISGRSRDSPAKPAITIHDTFTFTAQPVAQNGATISQNIICSEQDQLCQNTTPGSSRTCKI